MMTKPYGNYDKEPVKRIESCRAYEGYGPITEAILGAVKDNENPVIVLETYTEVDVCEILEGLAGLFDIGGPQALRIAWSATGNTRKGSGRM